MKTSRAETLGTPFGAAESEKPADEGEWKFETDDMRDIEEKCEGAGEAVCNALLLDGTRED